MAGGGETSRGRASGEQVIQAAFQARRVPVIRMEEWQRLKQNAAVPASPLVVKLYPFTTIYQTAGNVDFVIMQDRRPSITMEVKHQGVSGSCDEKLAYVLVNALYTWPTDRGILILSGEHWASSRGIAAAVAMRRLASELKTAGQSFDIFDMTAATNWIARSF